MRGKEVDGFGFFCGLGITPAYAGKSVFLALRSAISWDHPRVCGEKAYVPANWGWLKGSPPRMRGKAQRGKGAASPFRITPAYAGKSRLLRPARRLARDHPRVCGEKVISFTSPRAARGSPPRMRGKDLQLLLRVPYKRITPAYAGKSFSISEGSSSRWDHPRVCGEKRRNAWLSIR